MAGEKLLIRRKKNPKTTRSVKWRLVIILPNATSIEYFLKPKRDYAEIDCFKIPNTAVPTM